MAQIGKLYSFYLKKIFKKNWLRITVVSAFIVGVIWFALPYLFYLGNKNSHDKNVDNQLRDPSISDEERERLRKLKSDLNSEISFRKWNQKLFGKEYNLLFQLDHRQLERKIKEFEDQIKSGASDKDLKEISSQVLILELGLKLGFGNITALVVNVDNSFFFNNTDGHNKGKEFWKLLNNISLWNLGGFFASFFLIYNILDKTFVSSEKDGEETMILTFTPGVKRSDLFWSKILAFLSFYAIINFFIFLLPYGFYYFWAAPEKSFGNFSILSLYSLIIGPLLYFGLYFTSYIFATSTSNFLGTIFSSLVSFFPLLWDFAKMRLFTTSLWPYTLEKYFFDPAVFTTLSLLSGTIFLFLYYWNYQEKDL